MTGLTDYLKQPTSTLNKMHEAPAFKTANEFSLHIESLASKMRITHMEAVLLFCEQHYLEPKDVSSKINKSLKEKIEVDFRNLNYLPKQAQLDV